ncbi:MAG: hypothetical protein U0Q12_18000 [Vicinamibacterales bacterium]
MAASLSSGVATVTGVFPIGGIVEGEVGPGSSTTAMGARRLVGDVARD